MRGLVGSNIGSGRDLPHQSLFFVFLAWICTSSAPQILLRPWSPAPGAKTGLLFIRYGHEDLILSFSK